MIPRALDKDQLQRLEATTMDMLQLIASDDDYFEWLRIMDALPDTDFNAFAQLGLMYLATERARRYVASTN